MGSRAHFCRELPKIELHAHLNGSISGETLKTLGCSNMSINEFQKLAVVINKSERTLEECFRLFKVAHNVTNNPDSLYKATQSVIEDFAKDNVIYLELRTTPRAEEGMSKELYTETVVKAIQDQSQSNILVKLILSIDRKDNDDNQLESLRVILQMKRKYPGFIRGIDLSGDPTIGRFNKELFEEARKNGLKTAIHCGEVKNDREVEEILKFGPDRIGHGTRLHANYQGTESLWTLYCEKKIPLECCLTSNVLCGTTESYKKHHVQEWIENDLPFSINTDDKGVFCTSLSKEYELLQEHFNLNFNDLWNVSRNAVHHSFASEEEKEKVIGRLQEWKESPLVWKKYFSHEME